MLLHVCPCSKSYGPNTILKILNRKNRVFLVSILLVVAILSEIISICMYLVS